MTTLFKENKKKLTTERSKWRIKTYKAWSCLIGWAK